MTDHFYNRSHS